MVPHAMIDELCLVGPIGSVRERLDAWRAAGVTTLIARAENAETIRALAEAAT
jgi:hypothetical protein